MSNKFSNVLIRPIFKIHGVDTTRRLTKIFRDDLKRSWVHPYVRVRKIYREYKLPILVTSLFLVIVVAALSLRASQRSSLANLLATASSIGEAYNTLVSQDKTDDLKRNNDTDANTPNTQTPAGSPSSFAINANNPQTSTPNGSNSTTTPDTTPPPVFSASIAYFRQDGVVLNCSTPKPKRQTCSKTYTFGAGVRTQNGPGAVTHEWRSNLPGAIEGGGFSVGGGDALTPLQKTVTLACIDTLSFSMQMNVLSPNLTRSATLNIDHNCNEI